MNAPLVTLPDDAKGLHIVASVSGGKDSTALILALLEAVDRGELPRELLRFAFADTVWEADEVYEYLDYLRAKLSIAIDVVGYPGGMVAKIREGARFAGRLQRWCTRELKIDHLRAYHDALIESTGIETVAAMGIRADESAARADMPEWDDEPPGDRSWGGFVWRPLIRWSVEDVLRIHNRHGIKVNPLYQEGFSRVGCCPCQFATKEEIALIAVRTPARIDLIDDLEHEVADIRRARNVEQPGRYKTVEGASFFQTQRKGFTGIRKVVEWARTERGGRQLPLLPSPPRGGCMRWGICDLPDGGTK